MNNNTKRLVFFILLAVLTTFAVMKYSPSQPAFIPVGYSEEVKVCQATNTDQIPSFELPGCQSLPLAEIDPQNKSLWIMLTFNGDRIKQHLEAPLGLFVFAKASSRVYLNNTLLGSNGEPSLNPGTEAAGLMDARFLIPNELLLDEGNELVVLLSSHQGYLNLMRPVHIIGISQWHPPSIFIQTFKELGLLLMGSFVLATIVFAAQSFNPQQRKISLIFMLMSVMATGQLYLEMSRALHPYLYPMHDLRLLLIVLLAFGFGISMLILVAIKFAIRYAIHWIYAGVILTGAALFWLPSYDVKTNMAIFLPAILSMAILLQNYRVTKDKIARNYMIAFIFFLLIIILAAGFFHEIVFYLLLAAMLCFMFINQTQDYARERLQMANLAYKIAQSEQDNKKAKLTISSAGKIDLIPLDDILYCQASGDYVELHQTAKQTLYSGSMKSLEPQLTDDFIKVHRSYMVNLNHVKALTSQAQSGTGLLILDNGAEVPVSRRVMPQVRSAIAS